MKYLMFFIFGLTLNHYVGLATVYQIDQIPRAQQIDGFGGSIAFWGTHADDEVLESALSGLKVSILRAQGEVSPDGRVDHNRDILERAMAINPNLSVLLNFWQPRSKQHLSVDYWLNVEEKNGSKIYRLKPERWSEWADEMVERVQLYLSWGVKVEVLGVQNESNWSHVGAQTCQWKPENLKAFIESKLIPRLKKSKMKVKLAVPDLAYLGEEASEMQRFLPVVLNESTDIIAYPMYDSYQKGQEDDLSSLKEHSKSLSAYKKNNFNEKRLWMTGTTGVQWNSDAWNTFGWLPGMSEHEKAIKAARYIHTTLVHAGANAFFWWGLVSSLAPDRVANPNVRQKHRDKNLVLVNEQHKEGRQSFLEKTKPYYAFQQYSKFIKPGYVRRYIEPPEGLELSMYSSPNENQVVVVAINDSESTKSLYLDIRGKMLSKVFVTDKTRNCSPAYMRGRLPAKSVTTLIYK